LFVLKKRELDLILASKALGRINLEAFIVKEKA